MAAKRGKSQARRNHGNNAGLPGWAWLVLGIVLTLGVVLMAPRLLKSADGDGFLRPRPNPDARPAASASDEDADPATDDGNAATDKPSQTADAAAKPTQFDFYTLLPGEEVAMSDAELAATAREEARRKASAQAKPANAAVPDAAQTTPAAASTPTPVAAAGKPATATDAAVAAAGNDTPYILQAGAFGASGDAETVKAKIALLGLGARVEAAQIGGKTVYRVRMGPYGSALELAEAKRKLASGGLPALAIKAR